MDGATVEMTANADPAIRGRETRRTAHVFSRFKTYSGAEHLCFRLIEEAVERGERVTLVTRHLPGALAHHIPAEVEVRSLAWAHRPTRFHFFESICDVLYSPFLFVLVPRDSDVDVYWNDNTLASLFIDSFLATKHRIFYCLQLPHFAYDQTMLVARSYPPLSWLVPLLAPIYRLLDRIFASRADLILTLSEKVRSDCQRVYRRSDVRVASPGIDVPQTDLIDPSFIRARLPVVTRHVLMTAGKLIPKKNFDLFVEVVDRLRRHGADVTGVIVGDGPLRSRISGLIESRGLTERCLMTGHVTEYRDVLRYMSGATIYLYLERDVPFGLTPLEAGSVGAPVVAFEGGGVEETVIDGENGRKVPSSWGADEIAGLLLELLSSPETLKLMGDTGRRRALRWTWHGAYERFSQLIDERPRGRGRPRFESRR